MFFVGVAPALLVLYVRASVPESPAWKAMEQRARPGLIATLKQNIGLSLYAIVLMTAFNFFSHGTQDLYPTFLREQHHFAPGTVTAITITLNIGAIVGGLFFGTLSERIGRRRAICIAALIALPVLPLWAFSSGAVALAAGAFLMQISVQGAWGVIPVHLNEISPDEIRATFPGLVYQLGNLIASVNATMQAEFAVAHGNPLAGTFRPRLAPRGADEVRLRRADGVGTRGQTADCVSSVRAGERDAAFDLSRIRQYAHFDARERQATRRVEDLSADLGGPSLRHRAVAGGRRRLRLQRCGKKTRGHEPGNHSRHTDLAI